MSFTGKLLLFLLLPLTCTVLSVTLIFYCLLSVAKNNREFDDTLWPSDEAASNDGVYGSET
jgi:hypothetical protein